MCAQHTIVRSYVRSFRPCVRCVVMASARLLLTLSAVLSALPAMAGEPPSVVVVEGVSLPVHLDGFHARVRDAILKVVDSGGWHGIDGGQSPCRDAICAAQLARGAGALFAVMVDGKYRTGGYDLRVQIWNGRDMVVDQATCEDCTGPEFVTRIEAIVAPLVDAENKKRAVLIPATPTAPVVQTPPVPAAPIGSAKRESPSYVAPLGWALVAGGVAATAGGAYLLWTDGQFENCVDTSAGTRNCSRERETHGGLPLVIGGAGLGVLGGALLLYHHIAAPRELTLRIGPASLALAGRF